MNYFVNRCNFLESQNKLYNQQINIYNIKISVVK